MLALGLVSQSIFIGGNIALSSIFIPIIRQKDVPPKLQVKLWDKLFEDSAKLMARCALVSFLCYLYEAYTADSGSPLRQSAIISGGLSIAVIPFTFGAIMGTIKQLKALASLENDQELVKHKFGSLIDRWNKLSVVRMLIFSAGFANALYYHIKN